MAELGVTAGHEQLAALREKAPSADMHRLRQALHAAALLYGDRTLELIPTLSYTDHAVESTLFFAEFCQDEDALIACLFQHALQCPDVQLSDIGQQFGRPVRDMVSRIHLLSHLYTTDWRKSVNDMKIMLVSVADDIRVLLLVLSVSSIMLKHLQEVKKQYRARLCKQSLQLFAPVAARLGIYTLKYRLELSAFPECYPIDSQHINVQMKELLASHGSFVTKTAVAVQEFLKKEGVTTEVMARQKQPYSIFQKMHSKSVSALEKVNDLFAIRVVVPTVADCYQVLGHLHRLGTPLSHRFKDYISFPKPNGYQSLHTCLIGLPHAPKDVMIEVQIRTKDMHRDAEYGVAAHWSYKEKGKSVLASARQLKLADVLLKQQTVSAQVIGGAENITLVNHIYVLTPDGDIIELPEGGTPLDFAFVLHTDLGLRFKSARVNGSIVPISYELENGDVVEIMTHKNPQPTLQWMEDLVTSSAKSKLRSYFLSHNRLQYLMKGKDMVNAELRSRGEHTLDADYTAIAMQKGQQVSLKEREDLLVKVGMGSVRTSSVLRASPPRLKKQARKVIAKKEVLSVRDRVSVRGEEITMPSRFAKCCNADVSKDTTQQIVGIVTRAGILSVHKSGCHMVKSANPDRTLVMDWIV